MRHGCIRGLRAASARRPLVPRLPACGVSSRGNLLPSRLLVRSFADVASGSEGSWKIRVSNIKGFVPEVQSPSENGRAN
eukprot:symbB.v1.2.021495.t1/scaffold1806.1/size131321/10